MIHNYLLPDGFAGLHCGQKLSPSRWAHLFTLDVKLHFDSWDKTWKLKQNKTTFFLIDWEATMFFNPPKLSAMNHTVQRGQILFFQNQSPANTSIRPGELEWFCLGLGKAFLWEEKSTGILKRYGNSLLSEGCLCENKMFPFPLQGSLTRRSFIGALVLLAHYCTAEPHRHQIPPVWHTWPIVEPQAILKLGYFWENLGE